MPASSRVPPSLPAPWAGFLAEVDRLLSRPVTLHCLGGFVLTILYGVPRVTGDINYIAALPSEEGRTLLAIAGAESKLGRKHKVHVQYVGIGDVPEEYEKRLTEMFPQRFSSLRLFALEVHDLVLSKLTRNSPKDAEDVKFLAAGKAISSVVLQERYYRELRPRISNGERHDLTLKLWLEEYFDR